jgi:hypothetical protein
MAENIPIHSIMPPAEVYVPKTDGGDEPSSRNTIIEDAATGQTANAYVRRLSTRHLCTVLQLYSHSLSLARALSLE